MALLLSGCAMNRTTRFEVLRPADIDLPNGVGSLVLVDRSEFDRQFWNVAEAIATGELPEADRAAAQQALVRFKEVLSQSPRFEKIVISPHRLKGNSLTMAFPTPLDWATVRNLCHRHKTDALVALEVFDTDFMVTETMKNITKTVKEDTIEREIEVPHYYASAQGPIKIGFRFYFPEGEQIVDQQIIGESRTWEHDADTKAEAISGLISASRAQQQLSANIGSSYAFKIAPLPITVQRSYYGKSKKSRHLEDGARFAEVGDWEMAIARWKQGLAVAPDKEKGRLCYNLALAHELQGNLEQALSWAQRGFSQYDNRAARAYVQTLQGRIRDEAVLDYQFQ